jgi:hypothetical protein
VTLDAGTEPDVPDAATTAAVCADVADAVPCAFAAVTWARSVEPLSAVCATYVDAVAPAMATHASPVELQRCHAYAYVGVVGEFHVPVLVVSVCPTFGVPVIAGSTLFDGALLPTAAV